MSSITSSPKRIEKVASDNVVVGFDLLSNLTYMSVLSMGDLPRDQVLEHSGRQRFKTAVFFEYIYLLAKRMGLEYTQAFQLVSEKARATNVKSLLLRFAASISSGESEREFIAQEAKVQAEQYGNEYDRSVEEPQEVDRRLRGYPGLGDTDHGGVPGIRHDGLHRSELHRAHGLYLVFHHLHRSVRHI